MPSRACRLKLALHSLVSSTLLETALVIVSMQVPNVAYRMAMNTRRLMAMAHGARFPLDAHSQKQMSC